MSENKRNSYILYGANGSPYSCKIRSFLRYKRIPFQWSPPTFAMGRWPTKFQHIKPKVIPVLEFPNGFSMNESTKIIKKIEEAHPQRSVLLNNKCYQFISDLLEDYADEWCSKLMFGLRWNRQIDQDFSSKYITYTAPFNVRDFAANAAKMRQVDRREIVGCDDDAEIHASLRETCDIFEEHLKSNYFLFGNVPSNADFAFYGQIGQFRVDCTSDKILRERYPMLFCWLYKMDDLSGIKYDDKLQTFQISNAAMQLLELCGNVYLPFLHSNYDGLLKGNEMFNVDVVINGKTFNHKQKVFKWQGKCLLTLREQFNALRGENGFDELRHILKKTHCWDVLNGDNMKSKL